MGTEVELKLALAPQDVGRFRRHAIFHGIQPSRRRLLSLYFDTPDFALSKRGIALRLRRVGYHWVQTLKAEAEAPGVLSHRPEWEVRVTGNHPDPAVLPKEAMHLLEGVDLAALAVCFSTEFTRVHWHIEQAGTVVEVALDVGVVRAGKREAPISEVEFELKQGDPDAIYALARGMAESLPLIIEPRSKARRGYVLAGVIEEAPARAGVVPLRKGQDARSAWAAMRDAALGQLLDNVPGVLAGGDSEYLHQARVAVRRLRATLSLGRDIGLERPTWVEDLRWLMGELSAARDWDVFATETLPRVQAYCGDPQRLDALAKAVAKRRMEAGDRARSAMMSPRFVALMLAMEGPPSWHGEPAFVVERWAGRTLARRLKRVLRLGKPIERLDPAGLHALRIALKRLRYSAEAFDGLGDKATRPYLKRLSRLQDVLGVANDLSVAKGLLGDLAHARHAHATGWVEGFLACEGRSQIRHAKRLYRDFCRARPFWA